MPTEWANYLSIFGFLFLTILVWLIPKDLVYSGAPDRAAWRDIRWWATALAAIQICIYILF